MLQRTLKIAQSGHNENDPAFCYMGGYNCRLEPTTRHCTYNRYSTVFTVHFVTRKCSMVNNECSVDNDGKSRLDAEKDLNFFIGPGLHVKLDFRKAFVLKNVICL